VIYTALIPKVGVFEQCKEIGKRSFSSLAELSAHRMSCAYKSEGRKFQKQISFLVSPNTIAAKKVSV